MILKKTTLTLVLAIFILTGCYNQPGLIEDNSYDRTKTGTAAGALAGALIGYNSGNHDSKSALIGGLLGATLGGAIGYNMDEQANRVARALGTGVNNDPLAALDPNRDIIVSKHPNYVKIMFRDRMMFAVNSSRLQPHAAMKIKKVRQVLANYPQTIVGVAGFTDNTGSYDYNQALSQDRAATVGNLLTINTRPLIKGCSYNHPIAPNNSRKNKALNRRVEVYLFANRNNMIDPCR
jgi:outer membrane protein OmpA-like peptidoglycan-associated protein